METKNTTIDGISTIGIDKDLPFGIYTVRSLNIPNDGDYYYDKESNTIRIWNSEVCNAVEEVIIFKCREPKFKNNDTCHTPLGIGIVVFTSITHRGDISTFTYTFTSPFSKITSFSFEEEYVVNAPWYHVTKYTRSENGTETYTWIESMGGTIYMFTLNVSSDSLTLRVISNECAAMNMMYNRIPFIKRESLINIPIGNSTMIDAI